jgi:hypothetical protein
MKHASLIAAAGVVLLANAFALVHAARNRTVEADADVILTDRELTYYPDPDDSGVALGLRWVDPGATRYSAALKPEEQEAHNWLDRSKLEEIGFDCHVDPADKDAYAFYNRQGARTAFAALEYDGAGWRSWVEWNEKIARAEQALAPQQNSFDAQRRQSSRLALIDASRDATVLRARHPDRSRVVITPAVIRVSVASGYRPGKSGVLTGYVQEVPSVIHTPSPFSDSFRAAQGKLYRDEKREDALYSVHLRYGRLLEPWVTGVEFGK